jgi:hypothetical protein
VSPEELERDNDRLDLQTALARADHAAKALHRISSLVGDRVEDLQHYDDAYLAYVVAHNEHLKLKNHWRAKYGEEQAT